MVMGDVETAMDLLEAGRTGAQWALVMARDRADLRPGS